MSQAEADATSWRGTGEGGRIKEATTTHWNSPNTGADNSSGFTALPGGARFWNGSFDEMGIRLIFGLPRKTIAAVRGAGYCTMENPELPVTLTTRATGFRFVA